MKLSNPTNAARQARMRFSVAVLTLVLLSLSFSAMAAGTAVGADGAVCTFFKNINKILNIASIAVVTIAVVFAGYQIAFAHKRISDVAPVLIGAVLIGGAAQFANMILPDMTDSCSTGAVIVLNLLGA